MRRGVTILWRIVTCGENALSSSAEYTGPREYCKMLDSKLALFEGVFKVLDMCREYLVLVVPKVMCIANHSIALLKAVYFLETLAEILLSSRRVLF